MLNKGQLLQWAERQVAFHKNTVELSKDYAMQTESRNKIEILESLMFMLEAGAFDDKDE